MELSLTPSSHNRFPLNGLLIKGNSVKNWLLEIQRMELNLGQLSVYALPGVAANSVWGCLIVPKYTLAAVDIGRNEFCQQVTSTFFIAERSELFPAMTITELEKLFENSTWLMHPELGLVELEDELDFRQFIRIPGKASIRVIRPEAELIRPKEITSFQIAPVDVEESLKKLEEEFFPKRQKLEEKSLSLFEKLKMAFYKLQFRKDVARGKSVGVTKLRSFPKQGQVNGFGKLMDVLMKPFLGKQGKSYNEKVQENLEDLEKRNQKQLDKLLEMLKNNPDDALKYAIPLDETGSSRGQNNGRLELSKRWSVLSLFASERPLRGRSGGSVDIGDHYQALREQYQKTADDLTAKKEYERAAFIYMKLLKNNRKAAEVLADGKLYDDAASVYLKHLNDKPKAAECFTQGNRIANAIELYKELNDNEKVGDMYTILHRKEEADVYYEQVANDYAGKSQFIKASLIYRQKMQLNSRAQQTLMKGWEANKDAVNCLKMYLSDFETDEDLKEELDRLYKTDVNPANQDKFLAVLKTDHLKRANLEVPVRDMAYEIVASSANNNPDIVKELRYFNPENAQLAKDTARYSIAKLRRK